LISIHSAEENKFVKDLANREKTKKPSVWIGAKRNNSLDYFEWTNGQAFSYSNWASGQPTNSIEPESHVVIHNRGTWIALGTCSAQPYICESDLSSE
jgi:hypothetical protein